jgi:hypothetical protein
MAIRLLTCGDIEALVRLCRAPRVAHIEQPALRKSKRLRLVRRMEDLRAPPARRLEQPKGNRVTLVTCRRVSNTCAAKFHFVLTRFSLASTRGRGTQW